MSEDERGYQIADWELRQQECPQCHGPASECSDAHKPWYPQRTICYLTQEREAANWLFDEIHADKPFHNGAGEYSAKRSRAFPYHYRDGVNVWVSSEDHDPDGDFLRTKSADDWRDGEPDDEPEGE